MGEVLQNWTRPELKDRIGYWAPKPDQIQLPDPEHCIQSTRGERVGVDLDENPKEEPSSHQASQTDR
ncbi:hypothetical protein H920_16736 [Fukomys damarensis]|uniref:Uncharacterized protein n=1 Tax=Fukomys damarensis TaxID=885580 RepID=A0A091CTU5_FUKDA|nr:hypothetical protein H920_16736 [Fukomys damarensis]